jgi:hypothetical protein
MTSTGGKEPPAVVPVLHGNAMGFIDGQGVLSGNTRQAGRWLLGEHPRVFVLCCGQHRHRSVHQRSSCPRNSQSLASLAEQDYLLILLLTDKEATVHKFQVLRTGVVIWAAPSLSQPLSPTTQI